MKLEIQKPSKPLVYATTSCNFLRLKLQAASCKNGFTLAEVLVSLGILTMVGILFITGFRAWNTRSNLDLAAMEVRTVLREAQGQATAVLSATSYGVTINKNAGTYASFSGSAYDPMSASSTVHVLTSGMYFDSINLQGSATTIIFSAFTGETSQFGTVVLAATADSALKKTITISTFGFVSIN